jgi:hypothetical protein
MPRNYKGMMRRFSRAMEANQLRMRVVMTRTLKESKKQTREASTRSGRSFTFEGPNGCQRSPERGPILVPGFRSPRCSVVLANGSNAVCSNGR